MEMSPGRTVDSFARALFGGSERKSRLHETIAFESTCSLCKWSERSVGGGKGEARERKDGKERK